MNHRREALENARNARDNFASHYYGCFPISWMHIEKLGVRLVSIDPTVLIVIIGVQKLRTQQQTPSVAMKTASGHLSPPKRRRIFDLAR
jgi:hypothetical protein